MKVKFWLQVVVHFYRRLEKHTWSSHLQSISDIGEMRCLRWAKDTKGHHPAKVCSPCCHLAKDTEVSTPVPPDYREASFPRQWDLWSVKGLLLVLHCTTLCCRMTFQCSNILQVNFVVWFMRMFFHIQTPKQSKYTPPLQQHSQMAETPRQDLSHGVTCSGTARGMWQRS